MEEQLILVKEFCTHHHIEANFIYSLRDYGLVEVISNEGNEFVSADKLNQLEKIVRLHYDLDVNVEGIDVILHLLQQLEEAEHEVHKLKSQLKLSRL